uniref:Uncharacterized protein n=1 Tax=Arundo donax TaxID=35708 RepID=A0A0A9H3A7_ARUDO
MSSLASAGTCSCNFVSHF